MILGGGQWNQSFDMLGPPFADNLAYTFHSFWASTKRDSIQRHLNFANRYDVPLFLGETGELTDEWNEKFRKLNEVHDIGWSFWTYKNLDSALDRGVDHAARRLGPRSWPIADGTRAGQARRCGDRRAMAQYLDGMQFKNGDGPLELSGVARAEGARLDPLTEPHSAGGGRG